MARINRLSFLILIASASLLSATNSGSATSYQHQAKQIEQACSDQHTSAAPVTTEGNQPRPRPTATKSTSYTYNYYYPTTGGGLALAGQVAAIISAAFLTIFTGGLWLTSVWQWHAMQGALEVNRPFLLVTGVSCAKVVPYEREDSAWHHHTFAITMRNFGVGPADITGYGIWSVPYNRPTTAEDEPVIQYLPKVRGAPLADSLVAPGEVAKDKITEIGTLSDVQYQAAKMGEKWISIHGFIRYRGASSKEYLSSFFWWCPLDRSGDPIRPVRALRKDLNDHT